MKRCRLRLSAAAFLLGLAAFSACQKKVAPLDPPEIFRWAEQPISFSPPPTGWRREGYNQGGLLGVRFIKTGSVGEGITVAEYSILTAIDSVVFRPERHSPPDSFQVTSRRDTTVSGLEAVAVDYEFHSPERLYGDESRSPARLYAGREYYFMKENHLFTAQYIGLPENLGLFDRVVSTITFPPRSPAPVP